MYLKYLNINLSMHHSVVSFSLRCIGDDDDDDDDDDEDLFIIHVHHYVFMCSLLTIHSWILTLFTFTLTIFTFTLVAQPSF